MRTETLVLQLARVLGYANFVALVLIILGIKGGWDSWLLVALPPLLAAVGTAVYYLLWGRLFAYTSKAEGLKYMRPYILGTVVTVSAVLLIFALGLLASRPT